MTGVISGCLSLVWVTAVTSAVQVTMPEHKKIAMLFQPTVLQCGYTTTSAKPALVQWKYKSFCQDRTEETLGIKAPQTKSSSGLGRDQNLDCADGSRTVRSVASKQGSTVTLGDFYKGRDITIIHDADLQFGNLQWGDSGLYYCNVVTPDDLEGKNEDRVELLVMDKSDVLADLLPSFEVEIMPEWVFVSLVILGTFLFFLMVGVCWCQCCPHSCCCYVRCPCCPETCCCPRALYEAGKAAKSGYPPPVPTACPPYYISTIPVAPVPAPMLMEKQHVPPLVQSDSLGGQNAVRKGYRIQADKERDSMKVLYYVEKELAQFDPARRMRERYSHTISELSSLHEDNTHLTRSYRQGRRKPLQSSCNIDGDAEYWSGVVGGTARPSTCSKFREERESFRSSLQRPTSEVLERKAFPMTVQAVSTDELAVFADSYKQRSRRADSRGPGSGPRFERSEIRGRSLYQDNSTDEYYGKRNHGRELFSDTERGWSFSPSRIRAPEDKHLPKRITRMGQSYDDAYLSSVLERKSRGLEETSLTPSKLSLRQNSSRSYGRSPTFKTGEGKEHKLEGEDSLPPYSERELSRALQFRSREHSYLSTSDKRKKKEQPTKTGDFPNRMSLVV
ncbi:immunoglobulin-like domain-containing receptor 2 isoform X2 [Bombina bombina]|uniref:immunoglobulin-like domain-containing receptor 2 isoform X2 n=1 Tax=Bombina bombina TaxID=8345 RepID=UPI00235A888E|nr:immunoglobulin-like domain-containing receptor 2 isoform X2 [Bombina bombina]